MLRLFPLFHTSVQVLLLRTVQQYRINLLLSYLRSGHQQISGSEGPPSKTVQRHRGGWGWASIPILLSLHAWMTERIELHSASCVLRPNNLLRVAKATEE